MGSEIPSPDLVIDATFGEDGYLSRVLTGYRPRAGQVAFSRAVFDAIQNKQHLLAEAGTGVGKSLGYSVPASYFAATNRTISVIATANIALQEQIFAKDLPLLTRAVPWKFTYSLLKGRNNYLCRDSIRSARVSAFNNRYDGRTPSPDEKKHLKIVQDWANESESRGVGIASGDKSELDFEPSPNVWRQFSVTSGECKGTRCEFSEECFANAALSRARNADVVVTNYSLLFAHVEVFRDSEMDLILPPFEVAILDECHKAPDIARDSFGLRGITREAVKRLGNLYEREMSIVDGNNFLGENLVEMIDKESTLFFSMLSTLHADRRRYNGRLTGDHTPEEHEAWARLREPLESGFNFLARQAEPLQLKYNELKAAYGKKDEQTIEVGERLHRVEKGIERANEILVNISHMMRAYNWHDQVYFLEEEGDRKSISIRSKLIAPSTVLTPFLFDRKTNPPAREGVVQHGNIGATTTVIGCSATLATGSGFGFIAEELGVPPNYGQIIASSPFDYVKQCLLIAPKIVEPNDERWEAEVIAAFQKIILFADGGVLGLFTSHRMLNAVCDGVAATCRKQGIRLLKQGDGPRTRLVEIFKEDKRSVLMGTDSLWAGVDVPGDACKVVVIDKFPFVSPSDPVLSALSVNDKNTFSTYSIPRAIMAVKQGFGRAVRAESDKKVVVLLDRRLESKGYGKQFRISLPKCSTSEFLEKIPGWLNPPPPASWDD